VGCFGGLAAVIGFAIIQGVGSILPGDGWIFASVAAGALGNVEGGRLAREMAGCVSSAGRRRCRSVLAVIIGISLRDRPFLSIHPSFRRVAGASLRGCCQLVFLGFIVWFRGLAFWGGIARVAQVQLLQPAFDLWPRDIAERRIPLSSMLTAAIIPPARHLPVKPATPAPGRTASPQQDSASI